MPLVRLGFLNKRDNVQRARLTTVLQCDNVRHHNNTGREQPINTTGRTKYYASLDIWRGLAALWVVMIHASPAVSPFLSLGNKSMYNQPLYKFADWGRLGVVMFFVISGYCISASAVSSLKHKDVARRYFTARIRRIYPPYLASVVFAASLDLLWHVMAHRHGLHSMNHTLDLRRQPPLFYLATASLSQLLLRVPLLQDVYWTLNYEVAFYVIVGIVLWLVRAKTAASVLLILNCFTTISLMVLCVRQGRIPFPLDLWYQFGLGVALYSIISEPKMKYLTCSNVSVFAMTMVYAYIYQGGYRMGLPSSRVDACFAIAFTLLLLILHRHDSYLAKAPWSRGLRLLGMFSYSLYLTHHAVITIPAHTMALLGFSGSLYWVSFIVQISVSVVVGYAFYRLVEQPYLNRRANMTVVRVRVQENTSTPINSP